MKNKKNIPKLIFPEFSDEWETKTLGEVLIKNRNKNKSQKYTNVESVSNKYGFIDQEKMFEDRRVASVDTSNYYIIEKGHFTYNPPRINVGYIAYKNNDKISIISPLYISFRTKNSFLIDDFLWYWFKTLEFTKQRDISFAGSVRNSLNFQNLTHITISLPSLPEQHKIASFLSLLDKKIELEKKTIKKIRATKKIFLATNV